MSAQTAEEVIVAIKNYSFGESREPLTRVENLVAMVNNAPPQRRAVAALLAALLNGNATPDAKRFACRQLAIIGGESEVPVIAALLQDPDTADMARYALEPIQGEAVDRALLDALDSAHLGSRIGIINSLGARKSRMAVRALGHIAAGSDAQEAEAARAALEHIGTARAHAALARARA